MVNVCRNLPSKRNSIRNEIPPFPLKPEESAAGFINKIPAASNVDKLIVNGKIYRGPETEKFPFYVTSALLLFVY